MTPSPPHDTSAPESPVDAARTRKFRQAAFVYLHLGVLYEAGVWVAWQAGVLTLGTGVVLFWLVAGAAIVGVVFWALWSLQLKWVARAVWAVGLLRLPALIRGAFFDEAAEVPPDFYLGALIVVLINLAFLARAGWDL